jgi:outer membrane immunogenic protein
MFRNRSRMFVFVLACVSLMAATDAQAQARWSGLYFGASAGQGRGNPDSRVDWNDTDRADGPHPPAVPADHSKSIDGVIGGVQFGWNRQQGRMVTGLEADLSFGDVEGAISLGGLLDPPFITTYAYDERLTLTRFGTVRGRLGFAPAETWLLHVTGGLAFGTAEAETNLRFFTLSGIQTVQYPGSASETRAGWTIGGGAEVALGDSLSARLDYLRFDLGTITVSGIRDPASPTLFTVNEQDVTGNVIRVGLSYRFGAR